jgi:hypothetical protein
MSHEEVDLGPADRRLAGYVNISTGRPVRRQLHWLGRMEAESRQKRCAAKDRSLSCVTSPVLSAHFVQLRLYRAIEFVVCGNQCVGQLLEPTGTQDD